MTLRDLLVKESREWYGSEADAAFMAGAQKVAATIRELVRSWIPEGDDEYYVGQRVVLASVLELLDELEPEEDNE